MDMKLQERTFLLLKDDADSSIAKKILRSPLGLAKDLIIRLNENNYAELKENLDKIKPFVAGIERAENLKEYKLANFYPSMFAFHQFFNSSFRARQGKVLEVIIQEILRNYTDCNIVPERVAEMQEVIQETYNLSQKPKLDIDALGKDEKNKKIIIVQLRSRDDTGGTTAKGSLVDFLRDLLRTNKYSEYQLLYLIAVWDERNSQQKNSTISKMYSSLKENIKIDEEFFENNMSNGIELSNNIFLKMSYGTDEISQALFKWNTSNNKDVLKSIKNITKTITNWDDLWVSYAISSLEIEINAFNNKTNIEILNNYFNKYKIKLDDRNIKEIDDITLKIASNWRENTIPFSSVSDKILYIRDLIYLKMIYNKLSS